MEVKNIIKTSAILLNNVDLANQIVATTPSYTQEQLLDLNLLTECVNLVCSTIASDYFPIIDITTITTTGEYNISDLSEYAVMDIISVTNTKTNESLPFSIIANKIVLSSGTVNVKYSYFPNELTINDQITFFPLKLNARIISYGVISEFYYIKGNFDDASIWDSRFKLDLLTISRPKKNVTIKKRRWF